MPHYVIIKKKNNVASLIATRVNLKRAKKIIEYNRDKYATYSIAEVVETITPYNQENNETGESIQEITN